VNAAIGLYSAIASGMIALTGIVFSLTFVMVQFSATAYSPRLVLWLARDPVISHAIGVFTATFLYALAALAWVDRSGSGRVPLAGVLVVGLLLIISVVMFISLIQRVGMLSSKTRNMPFVCWWTSLSGRCLPQSMIRRRPCRPLTKLRTC
jgi:uncharacterized membrane protein